MNAAGWTAILLAGERPGETDFAGSQGVAAKALIPVGGEPMLARVADALLRSPSVSRVDLLAQETKPLVAGDLGWLATDPRITLGRSGDGISSSIQARLSSGAVAFPVLVTTADHALITPEIIETFLAGAGGADVAVGLVDRSTIEAAYPETRRTWLRFSDGDYSGANLFVLRTPAAHACLDLWSSVERDRKKVRRLVMRFGPILAIRALTRTITLDAAIDAVGRKIGVRIKAVRLPYAEAAMDVDKPSDLELAERILAARVSA